MHSLIELAQLHQLKIEYQADAIDHMMAMQFATSYDVSMIDAQPEVSWEMRPFLLDFLVESHLGLDLNIESLFLAVNIIDRYTAKRVIRRKHYQLVGITALWIASKYQDKKDRIPTLGELKTLCCDAYQPQMFLQMELHILSSLDWSIGHPTHDLYVDLLCDPLPSALYVRHVALYICELSLYQRVLVSFPTSVVATCAVQLAKLVVCYAQDPSHQLACTCYNSLDTAACDPVCLQYLAQILNSGSASLVRKFSHSTHLSVHALVQDYSQALAGGTLTPPSVPDSTVYASLSSLSASPASSSSSSSSSTSPSSLSTPTTTSTSSTASTPTQNESTPACIYPNATPKYHLKPDAIFVAPEAYMTPPFTPQNCAH